MDPSKLSRSDARDIARILEATGRTVEALKWVPDLADEALARIGADSIAAALW